MALKPILRMGNPFLHQLAKPVKEFNTAALQLLVTDMVETMKAASGAGLAAPQIGVDLRMVIFGGGKSSRYPDAQAVPFTVLINPDIDVIDTHQEEDWEGCLSVPGLRGKVPRYHRIRYRGFDIHGGIIDRDVTGFHARVVQHEYDHLDGILFPQRIVDMKSFGFEDQLDMT